jgi:hypothetical protein
MGFDLCLDCSMVIPRGRVFCQICRDLERNSTADTTRKAESKLFYKVSPELVDGEHWSIVESRDVLLSNISDWLDEFGLDKSNEGESFNVEIKSFTQEELDEMKEL